MLMEYDAYAGKWATTKGLLSENSGSEPQKESTDGGEREHKTLRSGWRNWVR